MGGRLAHKVALLMRLGLAEAAEAGVQKADKVADLFRLCRIKTAGAVYLVLLSSFMFSLNTKIYILI